MTKERKIFIAVLALVMSLALIFGLFGALASTFGVANAADAEDDDSGVVFPQPRADVEVDLGSKSHLHWVLSAYKSDLRSGMVYSYSYKDEFNDPQTYYSMAKVENAPNANWKDWSYIGATDVDFSIVRYRTSAKFYHQIELFSDMADSFTVTGYTQDGQFTNRAEGIGRYVASAEIQANDGYVFVDTELATGSTLIERGMSINILDNGKRAKIEKVWYVAAFENSLLNGPQSIEAGEEREFEMPSWQFGNGGKNIGFPWLYHGDALLSDHEQDSDYLLKVGDTTITEIVDGVVKLNDDWNPQLSTATHDIVHFSLIRNGSEIIAANMPRSRWSYYINEYMPVGTYTLVFDVSTITLGAHYHWWDQSGEKHDTASGMAYDYLGFSRTFNFSVTPGTMTMNDSAVNQNGTDAKATQMYEVNVENFADHDYSSMFTPATNGITLGGVVSYNDVKTYGGFWGETAQAHYYDERPTLMFNFYRMNDKMGTAGNIYLPADSGEWSQYFEGPSDYTVYYLAQMKNYDTNPVSGSEQYEHFFYVKVYQIVATPMLNQTSVPYVGRVITVGPNSADTQLFKWTDNRKEEVGSYKVKFEFYNAGNYKWSGEKSSGVPYDFGDAYYIDWEITPYVVPEVTIAERYYTGNTITPVIPRPRNQINGEYIYAVKFPNGFSKGEFTDAGEYEITLTLASHNYVWENDSQKPAAEQSLERKIILKINAMQNKWEILPSIRHWQWGCFDRGLNRVEGTATRGTSSFTLYTDVTCRNAVPGFENFVPIDGMVKESYVEAFNKLPAGTYWLQAKVAEDVYGNYTGLTSDPVEVTVDVARNYWANNLNLIRWTNGSFDPQVNVITATPTFGERVTLSIYKYVDANEVPVAGLENIQISKGGVIQGTAAEILSTLDAGSYVLKASVVREVVGYDDDNKPCYNYSELNGEIDFVIQMATNYWQKTPYIQRWIVGEQIFEPTAEPTFGNPRFVITNNNGDVLYDAIIVNGNRNVTVNKLVTAMPGWHKLTTTVESDGVNYTSLNATMRFRVFGTEINFWRTVPNIQGWIEGETPNLPTAAAAFGDVEYTYKTVDGTVLDAVPTTAGDYILVATAKDAEYEDLISEVRFTITAKSAIQAGDDAGFIAGISVLAVVAALALAAVVAVIVINKKKSNSLQVSASDDDSESDN